MILKRILVFTLFFFSLAIAQSNTDVLVEERLKTIPLPDPTIYNGQTDAFAAAISAAYCDKARSDNLYLGKNGWIFTRKREIDFGRENLSIYDLNYDEIVFWLTEYRKALESVGFEDEVMMIVPSKALLGEAYLTDELKQVLLEQNTEADYYTMRQAYLDAGFKNVPDLLQTARNTSADGVYPHFPIDHHFTTHSAYYWAGEAAKAILNEDAYMSLSKTPVELHLTDRKWEVIGWEHMRQVWENCQIDYPKVYMPYYDLDYGEATPGLLEDVKPEIVVTGNSNIGFEFNRPGSAGEDVTPGTGTSDFLAHLTQLHVLKYGVFSLANSAIEQYLRTDFLNEAPPSFLVQYLEAHVYPYPPYNYRALPALTYGKCEKPVFEGTLKRSDLWVLNVPTLDLAEDSANYYLWLELPEPAAKHTQWALDESYSSGKSNTVRFSTDDRFMNFPTSFGLQLLPEQGALERVRVTVEGGWKGKSIAVSLCDIHQVQAAYKALER